MKLTVSCKVSNQIQKELANLQNKKEKIVRKLHQAQSVEARFRKMTTSLQQIQSRLLQIDQEIEISRARLSILHAKINQYENKKVNEVFKLQNTSIKHEQLQSLTIQAFTPHISTLDQLRLRLIEIEDGQELKKISHLFTIRKALINFMRRQGYKCQEGSLKGLQIYLCEIGKVGQFEQYVLCSLQEKKLVQFRLAILEPIKRYISILYQIKSAILTANMLSNSPFDEQKARYLVEQLRKMEGIEKESCDFIKKMTDKIDKTRYKAEKYKEYLAELEGEKGEISRELQMLLKNRTEISINKTSLNQLVAELREIEEAIDYLSLKISKGENVNYLNSPKTMNLISRCQDRWGSPVSAVFRQ